MAIKKEECPFHDLVMPKTNTDTHLESRVGKVEGIVQTLARDVEEIGKSIHDLTSNFSVFQENIGNKIIGAARPQWPLIISMVTLVITILAMSGSLITFVLSGHGSSISELRTVDAYIQDKMYKDQYDKGQSDAWRIHVNANMASTDAVLQREMKLVNETVEAKLMALDNKLQKEFSGYHRLMETQIDTINASLNKVEERQYINTGLINKLNK